MISMPGLAGGIGDKATKPKNEVEALFGYTSFSGADRQAKKRRLQSRLIYNEGSS